MRNMTIDNYVTVRACHSDRDHWHDTSGGLCMQLASVEQLRPGSDDVQIS